MRREQINKINVERLSRWKNKLNESHATPVVLVSVGHDHNNGKVVICTTEETTDTQILLFMKEAVRQIEQSVSAKN